MTTLGLVVLLADTLMHVFHQTFLTKLLVCVERSAGGPSRLLPLSASASLLTAFVVAGCLADRRQPGGGHLVHFTFEGPQRSRGSPDLLQSGSVWGVMLPPALVISASYASHKHRLSRFLSLCSLDLAKILAGDQNWWPESICLVIVMEECWVLGKFVF